MLSPWPAVDARMFLPSRALRRGILPKGRAGTRAVQLLAGATGRGLAVIPASQSWVSRGNRRTEAAAPPPTHWIAMTDFIREVEEEYRRDKAIEAWKRYQNWIIAAAILIVVAAGAWRFWETRQKQAAEAAGARFETAIQLAREGKPQEAEAAFLEIARSGPPGYAAEGKAGTRPDG